MLGVPHCNSTKTKARSRTVLALGLCAAALTLSAGTASASAHPSASSARVVPPAGAVTTCQSVVAHLPGPVDREVMALCKLVNGWD